MAHSVSWLQSRVGELQERIVELSGLEIIRQHWPGSE